MDQYIRKDSRKTATAQRECADKNIVIYWNYSLDNWVCKWHGKIIFEFETGKKFNVIELKAHLHRHKTRKESILKTLKANKEKNKQNIDEEFDYFKKHTKKNVTDYKFKGKKHFVLGESK
jgi:hypothetical protein